jgi:O-methyltransferase involved in polyketide biosynthesis
MNRAYLTSSELAAAIARGVRQLVFIGTQKNAALPVETPAHGSLQLYAVDEEEPVNSDATFVPTQFETEGLASALSRSSFDKLKTTLFIWLGDARYRTADAALSTLSFIASLPKGTGVIFDYAAERSSAASFAGTALDALASRISCSGAVKLLVQPQAVAAMIRGLGFGQMTDHPDDDLVPAMGHIVTAHT